MTFSTSLRSVSNSVFSPNLSFFNLVDLTVKLDYERNEGKIYHAKQEIYSTVAGENITTATTLISALQFFSSYGEKMKVAAYDTSIKDEYLDSEEEIIYDNACVKIYSFGEDTQFEVYDSEDNLIFTLYSSFSVDGFCYSIEMVIAEAVSYYYKQFLSVIL